MIIFQQNQNNICIIKILVVSLYYNLIQPHFNKSHHMSKFFKWGHQLPHPYRIENDFNCITIDNWKDFSNKLAYCREHNLVYNYTEEERKLYNAEPCIFTDTRFDTEYGSCSTTYLRSKFSFSLKAAFRAIEKIRGIPLGTEIEISTHWYYRKLRKPPTYLYKVKKYNPNPFTYVIDDEIWNYTFSDNQVLNELMLLLRNNEFLVTTSYDRHEMGEIMGYGFGKYFFISFDSERDLYDVNFDFFGYFDKRSRMEYESCPTIDTVLEFLKQPITDELKNEIYGN